MRKTTKTNNIVSKEEFGMRLRQLRKEKNLNQSDIAEKLRVSRSSVANWENGIRFPDYQSIKRLAVIFGVSVDYLYGQSSHRYNINIPDYFELDLTKLSDAGMDMLYEYYKMLLGTEKYRADTEKNA